MNKNNNLSDNRLNLLFAKAREAEQEASVREIGFEGRLMARHREERCLGAAPWYLWAWRSAPLFTVVVITLITVCGVRTSGVDSSLTQALTGGGYEESVLVSYYAGE